MHLNEMHALRSSKSEAGPCYAEASHGTANILNIYIPRARESKGSPLIRSICVIRGKKCLQASFTKMVEQ